MRKYLSADVMIAPNPAKAMSVIAGMDVEHPVIPPQPPSLKKEPEKKLGIWARLAKWVMSLFLLCVVFTAGAQATLPPMDSVNTKWFGDAIELINGFMKSGEGTNPVKEARAARITLNNLKKKTKRVIYLNEQLEKGEIYPYQYDVLMADALETDLIYVKQLRALQIKQEGR